MPTNAPRPARCSRPTVGATGLLGQGGAHGATCNLPLVAPTVGRLPLLPAPRLPTNAPRPARCGRPRVGATGWLRRGGAHGAIWILPLVAPTVGRLPSLLRSPRQMHRALRGAADQRSALPGCCAEARHTGQSGSSPRSADRWSAALAPSATPPDKRTAPCAVQPTNGRRYRVVAPRRGTRGNLNPPLVAPTVGRLPLLLRHAPDKRTAPCAVKPTNGRRYRVVGPTVGSTGVGSRTAPQRTRPAPSRHAWRRARCRGSRAGCWRRPRRSNAPRRCSW